MTAACVAYCLRGGLRTAHGVVGLLVQNPSLTGPLDCRAPFKSLCLGARW